MSCANTVRESRAFTICSPRESKLGDVVQEVAGLLHTSGQTSIISIQQGTIQLFTNIPDTCTLDGAEETSPDNIKPCHLGNYLLKDGIWYSLPEKLDDEINSTKLEALQLQEDKYISIDWESQINVHIKITGASLKLSSSYNNQSLQRKSKVTSIPLDSADDIELISVKKKRKRQNKQQRTSLRKKCTKLLEKRVRHLSNQDSDSPISCSSVEKEADKPDNTKEARVYSTRSTVRKRKVTEDESKPQKAPCNDKTRPSSNLGEATKQSADTLQSKHNLQSLTGSKQKKTKGNAKSKKAATVKEEHTTSRALQQSVARRSRGLENKEPHERYKAYIEKQRPYKEYEDTSNVENYCGKENDVLSLVSSKKKEEDDGNNEYSSWLRDRTNLPSTSRHNRPIPPQEIIAYPLRKGKKGSSRPASGAPRRDTDRVPVQTTDQEDQPSLPPREHVVTSSVSVYRQNQLQQAPPPTTNLSSYAHEQALIQRLRGLANRSRHGRAPPPAKHPQYADTAARRSSYVHWPRETRQDPNTMANYGFFHTGRVDLVRCFQCGIGLKDWSEPDEPLFEHIKHSPDCPFLLRLLGPELLAAYKVNLVPGSAQPTDPRLPPVEVPSADAARSEGAVGGSPAPPPGIRSPQYADLSARLRSFDSSWARNMSQSPLEVAEAGFYYTGEGDVCRCFTCDGGLTRWDPQDDPWVEHAKWFPQCAFVRQVKGDEYVNLIQQAIASTDEDEDASRSAEARMADLTVQTAPDPLTTPAARGALDMGYSRSAVALAIHELIAKEKTTYTAVDIVEILVAKQERGEALPTDSPQDTQPMNVDPPSSPQDKATLERDNTRLRTILKCMLCEDRFANILFIPCTHHRLCEECAADVTMCPVCGRNVEKKVKTYMS